MWNMFKKCNHLKTLQGFMFNLCVKITYILVAICIIIINDSLGIEKKLGDVPKGGRGKKITCTHTCNGQDF